MKLPFTKIEKILIIYEKTTNLILDTLDKFYKGTGKSNYLVHRIDDDIASFSYTNDKEGRKYNSSFHFDIDVFSFFSFPEDLEVTIEINKEFKSKLITLKFDML